jgi:hypothetical protein
VEPVLAESQAHHFADLEVFEANGAHALLKNFICLLFGAGIYLQKIKLPIDLHFSGL